MTDDRSPSRPGPGPDAGTADRDEQLAALLGVAPLEAHTRTRVVRRALDEMPASPRYRPRLALAAAAAAVVSAIAIGGVVVLNGGTDHTRPRLAVGPGSKPAGGSPSTLGAGSAAPVAPRDLGDVGDVTDPARLRLVLAGPSGRPSRALGSALRGCGDLATTARLIRLDTVGTGVDAGRAVAVVAGPDAAGQRVAAVVAVRGCSVLQRFALG